MDSDPKARVLWWHASEDLVSFTNVANTNHLHLKHVDLCDRGFYYCTLESSNYEIGQSANIVIVQQQGPLGYVYFLSLILILSVKCQSCLKIRTNRETGARGRFQERMEGSVYLCLLTFVCSTSTSNKRFVLLFCGVSFKYCIAFQKK